MSIAVPIMIQNGITNFVNMLDNVMVGRVGTDPMSGVAIVNQLMFVMNLCIFGGLSGIGIFTAQYYGKGDHEGVRYTFRLQIIAAIVITAAGILLLHFGDTALISLYLHADDGATNADATLMYALSYMAVMFIGILPFALGQVYSSTLRSTGETVVPMVASIIAVAVNLVGNYILIFGKFGAPALGVVGAAWATVLSRFIECSVVAAWTHLNAAKNIFIQGAYRSLYVPRALVFSCLQKGFPLMLNETLWSLGMAAVTQGYSIRGLSVVAAFNISQTMSNVFNVAFIAMGNATAIIMGQMLGAGGADDRENTLHEAFRLIAFSIVLCFISGAVMFLVSGLFPKIYNTSDEIRALATGLIRISAIAMPIYAFENAAYFIIRSGGKTFITFLFDSCFVWVVILPLLNVLTRFTGLPVLAIFAIVQSAELIKCAIGYALVKKGIWIQDVTKLVKTA